jgi:hypothetical protein
VRRPRRWRPYLPVCGGFSQPSLRRILRIPLVSGSPDAALARVGRQRRIAMTLPVFSGVYRAVSQSDLIALIPHQLALQVAPKAGLSVYCAPMPIDPVQIAMVWHRRSTSAPGHCWLRDRIAESCHPWTTLNLRQSASNDAIAAWALTALRHKKTAGRSCRRLLRPVRRTEACARSSFPHRSS